MSVRQKLYLLLCTFAIDFRLIAGPELDPKPMVDVTYDTVTSTPKIAGVPQLTPTTFPPGTFPSYYKTIKFNGERWLASGPYAGGAPCPQILNNRDKVSGQIVYAYNAATDQIVINNASVVEQGRDTTTPPWDYNTPNWPSESYLDHAKVLPLTIVGQVSPSGNNPLGLNVTSPVTAQDDNVFGWGIGGYVCITAGEGRNNFQMVLSDEDRPSDAEGRAKLTTVVGAPADSATSIRGSMDQGTQWTIRKVKVHYKLRQSCPGVFTIVKTFQSRPINSGPGWMTTWGATESVTIENSTAPDREFDLPLIDNMEVALVSILVKPPQGCSTCTDQALMGGISGPTNGSIYWYIPLGLRPDGLGVGGITLHQATITPAIYSPAALTPALDPQTAVQINDAQGNLRQILAPQGLVDVVTTAAQAYELRFYDRAFVGTPGAGGIYTPTGVAYLTWRIENPDATGATANRLRVTRINGASNLVTEIDESQAGTRIFSEAGGLRITQTTISGDPNGAHTETIIVKDAAGNVASKKFVEYSTFAWGSERTKEILDPDGAALTTQWTYDTNSSHASYRQLLTTSRPDGFLETNAYDGTGALISRITPVWDTQLQVDGTSVQFGDFNNDGVPDKLTTTTTSKFLTTLRKEFTVDWGGTGKRDHYLAVNGSSLWNDPTNILTRESYSADGKLLSRLAPDGTITLRSSTHNTDGTTTVVESQGASNATRTAVVDGTIRTEIYSAKGLLQSAVVTDVTTGFVLDSLTATATDSLGRPISLVHTDGSVETRTYCATCGQIVSMSLRGETTNYVYDDLNQKIEETHSAGSTVVSKLRFKYDAEGRLLQHIRVDLQSNTETVLASTGYDLAGRVISETSLQQGTTTYAYAFGANNTTTTTTTYADGGTRIETRGASGSPIRVRGTAVAAIDYTYTEGGAAYLTETRNLNDDNSYTMERQSINLLGDVTYTEYANSIRTSRYFDAIGRVIREVDPDGVTILYTYDARGRLSDTVVDLNKDGVADYSGTDRVTRTLYGVASHDGVTVQTTITQVWETDNQNTPTTISVSEVGVDGRHSWQTKRGLTSSSVTAYDGLGGHTMTTTAPDDTTTVQSYLGDRLVSTTVTATGNTQLSATTYAYDSSARLTSTTDVRNGATTYAYDAQDRLASVTTPDPDLVRSGPGYDRQTTGYAYDAMGRVSAVTQPDSGVVNTAYYVTGQVRRTWGARTYPVEYTYDVQTRIKTMTTWQNFAGDSGRAVTTWNYDSSRGWLLNKRYHDNTGPSYNYTSAGRLASRVWARTPTITTSYGYNTAGECTSISYSNGTPNVTTAYDREGRPKSVTDVAGLRTLGYDSVSGQLQSETYVTGLLAGAAVTRTYDSLYRPNTLASSFGTAALTASTYGYGAGSRLQVVTNGANTVTYGYVSNSSLVQSVGFAAASVTQLATSKTHDKLNRLATVVNTYNAATPAVLSHAYTYNAANQRVRATREDNSYWSYSYDDLGQVTSGSKSLPDGTPALGLAYGYSFDDIGNRKTSTVNSQTATYSPNLLNQYSQRTVPPYLDVSGAALTGAPVAVSANNYAALASRQGEAFFHQVPVDNSILPQVVNVHVATEQSPDGAAVAASQQRTALVSRTPETFTYDADGNLTDDATWHYTWDGENRLIGMATSASAQSAGLAPVRLDFAYDGQGRRVQKTVTTSPPAGLVTVRRDYFTNNSLTGAPASTVYGGNIDDLWLQGQGMPYLTPFSYRVTAALYVPVGGPWTFQINLAYSGARLYIDNMSVIDLWNGTGVSSATVNLAAGQAHTLRYEAQFNGGPGGATPVSQLDWSGPLVTRQRVPNAAGTMLNPVTVATRYLYDGWNLLAELEATGAPVRTYVWGLDLSGGMQGAGGVGGLVMLTDLTAHSSQPSTNFPAFDGNGNVVGLVRASDGALTAKYDYNAFGETVLTEGALAASNPFRFSTKYTDNETGQVYYGYRCYSPTTGRWLSRDTIGERGGGNIYLFTQNSATDRIDPLGQAVYLTTRPLDIPVLKKLACADVVHVYLSFDISDLTGTEQAEWVRMVTESNDVASIPQGVMKPLNPQVPYVNDPILTTFSFHPYSVATGDGRLNHTSTIDTYGSYVAYNDPIDQAAFAMKGTGYKRRRVVSENFQLQARIYRAAVRSRNINNSSPTSVDPSRYQFPTCNCGSWAELILRRNGVEISNELINLGVGLGRGLDKSPIPGAVTIIGKGINVGPNQNAGVNILDWKF